MCQVILEKHTEYLTVILQGELILGLSLIHILLFLLVQPVKTRQETQSNATDNTKNFFFRENIS